MDAGLLASLVTFTIACGSPGPATLAVTGTAMAQGMRQGLAMAAVLTLGLAAWGLPAGLGFGALVAQSAAALTVMKLLGGAYLLYLSWVTARSALRPAETVLKSGGGFRRGLLLNLSNPKAVLAWIATLALGTDAAARAPLATVAACTVIGFLLYALYALLFSRAPVMALYRRARRGIEAGFAALFAAAGLRLLLWRTPA